MIELYWTLEQHATVVTKKAICWRGPLPPGHTHIHTHTDAGGKLWAIQHQRLREREKQQRKQHLELESFSKCLIEFDRTWLKNPNLPPFIYQIYLHDVICWRNHPDNHPDNHQQPAFSTQNPQIHNTIFKVLHLISFLHLAMWYPPIMVGLIDMFWAWWISTFHHYNIPHAWFVIFVWLDFFYLIFEKTIHSFVSLLVGGFKHVLFSTTYGMSSFPLTFTHIFQDGYCTTNQLGYHHY